MSDTAMDDTAMGGTPTGDTDVLFHDDVDDMAEMPTRASRRIVTAWTVVFAALVIAGAGFVAGIQMEKHNEPASAATGLPAGFRGFGNGGAGLPTGQFPGAATGQLPGGATNAPTGGTGTGATGTGATGTDATGTDTTGTVKLVDGSNVYITTSDGSTVKVTTTAASTVAKSVPGSLADLQVGDTVTVEGTADPSGTIAATSISQSP